MLAAADLPRENAFYYAHLNSAERLTPTLRQVNWQVLDDLAARDGDAEAAVIVSALRQAARRDEQEIALAVPLRKASDDAITLFLSRSKKPAEDHRPTPGQGPEPMRTGSGDRPSVEVQPGPDTAVEPLLSPERVRARDVPAFVERICEAADENPGADFEIAWRIVDH